MSSMELMPRRRLWPLACLCVLASYLALLGLWPALQAAREAVANRQAQVQSRLAQRDVSPPAAAQLDPALSLILRLEQAGTPGVALVRLESDSRSQSMQLTVRGDGIGQVRDWMDHLRVSGLRVRLLSQAPLVAQKNESATLEARIEVRP